MKADYIIRGGRVMDPAANVNEVRDVVIRNSRVVDPKGEAVECGHIIDATGCLVFPGFVDFHCHVFAEGSGIAIRPDMMIPLGTTAAVDAGTAGTVNYEAFHKTVVDRSIVRMKTFLTTYSGGQLDPKLCEDFDPKLINFDRMERIIDQYQGEILGLKIRLSNGVVPAETKLDYIKALIELAEELDRRLGTSLRICVHTTNLIVTAGEFAEALRPGDIFCHCYHGMGNTIIGEDGRVDEKVKEAKKRGVIFDAANGKGNFGIATARKAIADGFYPDIISSDLTNDKFNMPPYAKNLLFVMAKYNAMGMDQMEIIRAVTQTPAKIMGMEGKIGTLAPGAYADVAIMKEKQMSYIQKDFKEEECVCDRLLVPQMTICAGEIQFCQPDFWY